MTRLHSKNEVSYSIECKIVDTVASFAMNSIGPYCRIIKLILKVIRYSGKLLGLYEALLDIIKSSSITLSLQRIICLAIMI